MSQWLIDPYNIINFKRSEPELELLWLFSGVAAGKVAKTQAKSLAFMLDGLKGSTPFEKVERAVKDNGLLVALNYSRLGQYGRLTGFMKGSLVLRGKLKTCSLADLEAIHGVGPKTARMFLMFSRPDQPYAALDTHILKHLKAEGFQVPKTTPTGPQYRRLETVFLGLAFRAGKTPAEYDHEIWKRYNAAPKNRDASGVRPVREEVLRVAA